MSCGRTMLLAAAVLLPGSLTAKAHAEQASDPPAAPPTAAAKGEYNQTYTPADFARFAPRNALDMLRQVPGFTIRNDGQGRGLGQASENVLLNGQRVANKSGGAVAKLETISADQVERIEIVDGASLDIPGLSGHVANVITKPGKKASGQFSWQPEFHAHFADPILTRGAISYSATTGPVDYTLALDSNGYRGGTGGPTVLFDALHQPIEVRDDRASFRGDDPKLSTRLTLDGPGSSIGNANIAYWLHRSRSREVSHRVPVDGVANTQVFGSNFKGHELELGGDYAFGLVGGRLKLIGLMNRQAQPSVSTGTALFADGSPETGDKVEGESHTRETIGRAEYGWKWGHSDFQLSAEAAFNSLDNNSRLFTLDPVGSLVEIPFPNASGRVTEDRYELLATYGRPLAPRLTMQLIAGGEHSTLAAGGVSRTFLRPKGSFSLLWKVDARTDINLKIERSVGQLNFYDFLASVNLTDNRENAGNAELVPSQSWDLNLDVDHGLGSWGTTHLLLYAQLISDITDIIPVGDGESLGNIDRATRYGAEWKSTFLFDPIGWKGAKLDATVRFQHTSLRDPLTGESRPISGNSKRLVMLDLRHDIPGSKWAWELHAYAERRALNVRLTEVSRQWDGPVWVNIFVENKDVFGMTVQARIENFANAHNHRDRTVFDPRRTDPILFVEDRNRLIGRIFSFSVRGNF